MQHVLFSDRISFFKIAYEYYFMNIVKNTIQNFRAAFSWAQPLFDKNENKVVYRVVDIEFKVNFSKIKIADIFKKIYNSLDENY